MTLGAGGILAERYRLDRLLGQGGMGSVWAATHLVTGKVVAVKLLKPELAGDAALVERFLREARAACAVKHPNVVQIHDVLLAGGCPGMVMDLLEGESLGEHLGRVGAMPVAEVAKVLLPVVGAVRAAHAAHVVHRDLKPDNLFLERRRGGGLDVKVLDFGIAKITANEGAVAHHTKTGAMIGTPFYMSPEQLFGERDVDHRADVWALGIILYECLTGRRPTEADNLGQILKVVTQTGIPPLTTVAPHVPQDVAQLVERMLIRDRAARLADLDEVRVVLERHTGTNVTPQGVVSVTSSTTTGAAPAVAVAGTRPWPSPTAAVIAVAAVLALLGAAGLVLLGVRERRATAPPPKAEPEAAPLALTASVAYSSAPRDAPAPPPSSAGAAASMSPEAREDAGVRATVFRRATPPREAPASTSGTPPPSAPPRPSSAGNPLHENVPF